MRTGRPIVVVILALLAAGAPWVGQAQELIDRRARFERRADPSGISLDRAVEMALRRYGGKAVRAETVQSGDRRIHQIRLLSDDGKVTTVRVDAISGAMN